MEGCVEPQHSRSRPLNVGRTGKVPILQFDQPQFATDAVGFGQCHVVDVDRVAGSRDRLEVLEVREVILPAVPFASFAIGEREPVTAQRADADGVPTGARAEVGGRGMREVGARDRAFRWQREFDADHARVHHSEIRQAERPGFRVCIEPLLEMRQILAPVDVAVHQVFVTARWATDRFVEVRKAVRVVPQAAGDGPDERGECRCSQCP